MGKVYKLVCDRCSNLIAIEDDMKSFVNECCVHKFVAVYNDGADKLECYLCYDCYHAVNNYITNEIREVNDDEQNDV